MVIRHCVEESNIDENFVVIDPTQIRHVTVKGSCIESMSGPIDPKSHLNLDYPDHKIKYCIITEKFVIGSKIMVDDKGMIFAQVNPNSFSHLGYVDYTDRLNKMIENVNKLRSERENSKIDDS